MDDMCLVAPLLHYNLRHAINWREWLDRRRWTKSVLLEFMNKCDFTVKDIKVVDGKEYCFVIVKHGISHWFLIDEMGSGFKALFGGIFEEVLKYSKWLEDQLNYEWEENE